jgi:hypothetical protein
MATEQADALVLWGGYARGAAFVTQANQFYKLHKRMEPKGFGGGPQTRSEGDEVFGFLLTQQTIAALKELDVRSVPASPANVRLRRALLVNDGSGRQEQQALEQHFQSRDVKTDTKSIPGCLQFLVEIPHKSRLPDAAIDEMVSWIAAGPAAEKPAVPITAVTTRGPHGEEPLVFGKRHPLFGIYHPPITHPPDTHPPLPGAGKALPPIVLSSAGTVHRIGPHRFYVGLARRWASLGFPVLRVDLSGIGDSPAADDGIENVTYPRDGYEDIGEALDFLEARLGA